jgi:hypothetical protein
MYINQQVGIGVMVAYFTAILVAAMDSRFLDAFVSGIFHAAKTVSCGRQICEAAGWESVFLGDVHAS